MKKFYSTGISKLLAQNTNATIRVDDTLLYAFIDENANAFVPFGSWFEIYMCTEYDLELVNKG